MNDDWIVTVHMVIDEIMQALGHRSHPLAGASDAEVLTVAMVAAQYFENHHARALDIMQRLGYLSGALSPSRLNRRLHALAGWLRLSLEALGELFARRGVSARQHARASLQAGAGVALPQGARPGLLRLLPGQAGEVLRVAAAPGLHRCGRAGGLRPCAGRPA